MKEYYEIDNLDRALLELLIADARTPFLEIAKKLNVSGGTIHVRFNKLREAGIIRGSHIDIDFAVLQFSIAAFVGINLQNARDYNVVKEKLKQLPNVKEIHFTTGKHSLFIKVLAKNTRDFHVFLTEKIQAMDEIQSTETLIILDSDISHRAIFS
jgi:Lrp/AsnC family transcriptional regulator for asnA, asnC and gidA